MRRNVGTMEGLWRVGLGGLALGAGLARRRPWLAGLGAVGLATGFSGYCLANRLLGIDTAREERARLSDGEQGRLASEPASAAG